MMKSIAIMIIVAMAALLASAQGAATKTAASIECSNKGSGAGVKTDDGLQYWEIRVGNGATCQRRQPGARPLYGMAHQRQKV